MKGCPFPLPECHWWPIDYCVHAWSSSTFGIPPNTNGQVEWIPMPSEPTWCQKIPEQWWISVSRLATPFPIESRPTGHESFFLVLALLADEQLFYQNGGGGRLFMSQMAAHHNPILAIIVHGRAVRYGMMHWQMWNKLTQQQCWTHLWVAFGYACKCSFALHFVAHSLTGFGLTNECTLNAPVPEKKQTLFFNLFAGLVCQSYPQFS